MVTNMSVKVYQDGKACRDVDGVILGRRSGGILIEFLINEYDEATDAYVDVIKPRWFTRRRRASGGVYECIGWNYWYYSDR